MLPLGEDRLGSVHLQFQATAGVLEWIPGVGGRLEVELPPLRGPLSFVLLQPPVDGVRPTQCGGYLLTRSLTDSNVNLI